ncbi:unnamed protein product [Didymodactylos carnosus]|uniref:Uncharacterized protein n=1 Tax=Didymodactylos carnosus TaxID=1234261 RepID=A0A8S2EHF1_9BILA|nr:unnamed protein product [Didymodactylos carnosus]CAF4033464.1 unnamed protein product [Didymodactylos carnosus]
MLTPRFGRLYNYLFTGSKPTLLSIIKGQPGFKRLFCTSHNLIIKALYQERYKDTINNIIQTYSPSSSDYQSIEQIGSSLISFAKTFDLQINGNQLGKTHCDVECHTYQRMVELLLKFVLLCEHVPFKRSHDLTIQAQNMEDDMCDTNEANKSDEIDDDFLSKLDQSDSLCNVYRDELENTKKLQSFGSIATFLNCGVVVGFDESARSEGMRRILRHIIRILRHGPLPPAMLYDCACTLRLFIDNWFGTQYLAGTDNSRFLKEMALAIDRFHQPGHKRRMCKTTMRADDPSHRGIFNGIDSSLCERMFSYFTKFKHSFQAYNYPKSFTFDLLLLHLKKTVQQLGYDRMNKQLEPQSYPNSYQQTKPIKTS